MTRLSSTCVILSGAKDLTRGPRCFVAFRIIRLSPTAVHRLMPIGETKRSPIVILSVSEGSSTRRQRNIHDRAPKAGKQNPRERGSVPMKPRHLPGRDASLFVEPERVEPVVFTTRMAPATILSWR